MPWTERTLMDDRLCFIAACLRAEQPMRALYARFGISRKTGLQMAGTDTGRRVPPRPDGSEPGATQPDAVDCPRDGCDDPGAAREANNLGSAQGWRWTILTGQPPAR